MKKSEFKCMDWIGSVREKHANELKGKKAQERIAFYRQKAQLLQKRMAREKVLHGGLCSGGSTLSCGKQTILWQLADCSLLSDC